MLDRTKAPAFDIPSHTSLRQVHSSKLLNGLNFHELIVGDQEVCRIEIIVRSGSWFDPGNGISYFTSKMLLEGTAKLGARQIADRLDYYGAYYEVAPGLDFVTLTVYSLSKYVGEVVPFFIEAVVNAIFPEPELETQKKIRLQQIRVNRQKTSSIASKGFRSLLFGPEHPYGRELEEKDLDNATTDVLRHFHQQLFFHQPEIFVSGKLSKDQISVLKEQFLSLPFVNSADPVYQSARPPFVRQILPLEESVQASLRIGSITVKKKHPDHFHIMLLNELFGGYFGSRLMKNIREDKGYTYGIYSSISYLQKEAFWVIGTDVKREVAVAAIEEIVKEMRILKDVPVPAAELETVRNYMAGTFLTSISTPFSLMDKFKSIYFSELGYEYYDQFLASIRTASADDMQRVANDFLKEDDWIQVVGGGI